MCVAFISYKQHARYSLVLTLNRDEFYKRPTTPLHVWSSGDVQIASGIDGKNGGTWLGVNDKGRMAAITNFRDPATYRKDLKSRGIIVRRFLENNVSVQDFVSELKQTRAEYNGYNLVFGDLGLLYYYSNVDDRFMVLGPGLYGLSNHFLDTPWPKVVRGKALFANQMQTEDVSISGIMEIMEDAVVPPDHELPQTGLKLELERMVAPIFIASAAHGYGTRSTSVVNLSYDGVMRIIEKTHPTGDGESDVREISFSTGRP